jgi:hypothetical protein
MKEWPVKWQIPNLKLCGPGLHICVTLASKIMMMQFNQVFLKLILFLRRTLLHELEGISLWSFDLEAVKDLNHQRIRYSITRYNVISKLISAEYSVVDELNDYLTNQDCLRLRLRLSSDEDAVIHVFINFDQQLNVEITFLTMIHFDTKILLQSLPQREKHWPMWELQRFEHLKTITSLETKLNVAGSNRRIIIGQYLLKAYKY